MNEPSGSRTWPVGSRNPTLFFWGYTPDTMHAAVLAMALSGCECGGESSDDAGTPILWHVDNHGSNSWNFLELSVTGEAPCAELDGAVP